MAISHSAVLPVVGGVHCVLLTTVVCGSKQALRKCNSRFAYFLLELDFPCFYMNISFFTTK